jgi:hypothetical protein
MEEILETLQNAVIVGLPGLLGALLVLLVGFVVALVLRSMVRALLDRTRIDERLDRKLDGTPDNFSIRDLAGLVVFWLVMLFAIVAALDMVNLGIIAAPFDNIFDRVLGFIPNLFSAAVLAIVAWIVATLVKKVLSGLLDSTNIDERLSNSAGMQQRIPLSQSISTLA